MAFFSLGIGPITWVYSTEIFPLKFGAGTQFWGGCEQSYECCSFNGFRFGASEILLEGPFSCLQAYLCW